MKLLVELNEEIQYFQEDKAGEKEYYLEGVVMQGDIKNGNGRVYPMSVLKKAVSKYNEEYVTKRRAFGELNHPSGGPSLNLDKVSHIITELRADGENIVGRLKVLDTPNGNIVKSFMKENCLLAISSRGLGSLKESRGAKVVQDDFTLITAGDIVHTPSAPDAFLKNLMEETDWVMKAGEWVPRFQEAAKKKVNRVSRPTISKEEREAVALSLFEEFLQRLKA